MAGNPIFAQFDKRAQRSMTAVVAEPATLDDVVLRTTGLFAVLLATAVPAWFLAGGSIGVPLVLGGMLGSLVVGLVIAFKKSISVPLIVAYAALEGVFVGAVSAWYQARYGDGIVTQAVLATAATFAGMLGAYKVGLIKVGARFRAFLAMALVGYLLFSLVNLGYALITSTPFGIGGSGPLGIGISVFAVGLAAFTLAADFDSVDRALRRGAPREYSWLLAHGFVVTIVWLYLEILRLMARLRD